MIVNTLNAVFNDIQQMGDVRRAMKADGYQLEVGTPADFAAFVTDEYERWGPIIREAGIA